MDKDKLILDSESFKTYYRKEKRAKTILLVFTSLVTIITGLSIALAFALPQDRLQDTTSDIEFFKMNVNQQAKVMEIVESLEGKSSEASFKADLASLLPATDRKAEPETVLSKPTQVAEIVVQKQPDAQKKDNSKPIQTPKPAGNDKLTVKSPSKPKTITQPKIVQQTKTVAPKTPSKPKQSTPAKPEKKTAIAGRFDSVDPIPVPAMAIRPPDANYGIPENWPINSPVSVPYGYRPERGRFHSGVDLDAEVGVPVEAAGAGKIIRAEWYAGYGMCVDIEHANGYVTRYGHLSQIYVTKSQWVEVGEWIGANGSTGNSSAPHVHFEVHQNGHSIDPEGINWTVRKMPPKAY